MTDAVPSGYDAIRVVGRGATGTVMLARQRTVGRLVAIKTIHHSAGAGAIGRLRREAVVLAQLNSPHIIPVYQLHDADHRLSLVMAWAPGGDLAAALPTLAGRQRVQVLLDVAMGLAAAHSRGIVHRDLKPANIVLDDGGRAVLADFGLARLPRATAYRTAGNLVTGTPLYLAPEQITAPDLEAPALDWYAYGVLAYLLLANAWPYATPDWKSVTRHHLESAPLPVSTLNPRLPVGLDPLLSALLDKDPDRRADPDRLCREIVAIPLAEWDRLIPLTGAPSAGRAPAAAALVASTAAETTDPGTPIGRAEPSPEPQARDRDDHPSETTATVDVPVFTVPRGHRVLWLATAGVLGALLGLVLYLIWSRM